MPQGQETYSSLVCFYGYCWKCDDSECEHYCHREPQPAPVGGVLVRKDSPSDRLSDVLAALRALGDDVQWTAPLPAVPGRRRRMW